jgi:hypothetical protein
MTGVERRMLQFIGHPFTLGLQLLQNSFSRVRVNTPSDYAKSNRSNERRIVGGSFLPIQSNIDLKGDSSLKKALITGVTGQDGGYQLARI